MKAKQEQMNFGQMHHIAIMRKSWGLTEKILTREKTVESRWYKSKRRPWDRIKAGDLVFFKDSGEAVTIKARVDKVLQFANLTPAATKKIMEEYGQADLGTKDILPEIKRYISDKNYCILIFLTGPRKVKPFYIDKTGYGAMTAWITIDDVNKIRI